MGGSSRVSRSEPGYRRPALVVQADSFRRSRIQTSIVAVIPTNLELAEAPGNVLLPARASGLSRDSVVNVSQLLTLDRGFLTEHVGTLPPRVQRSVDEMKGCALCCGFRRPMLDRLVNHHCHRTVRRHCVKVDWQGFSN